MTDRSDTQTSIQQISEPKTTEITKVYENYGKTNEQNLCLETNQTKPIIDFNSIQITITEQLSNDWSTERPFHCLVCSISFKTTNQLTLHLNKLHKNSLFLVIPQSNQSSNSDYNNSTQVPFRAIQPKPNEPKDRLICFKCNTYLNTSYELSQHLSNVHKIQTFSNTKKNSEKIGEKRMKSELKTQSNAESSEETVIIHNSAIGSIRIVAPIECDICGTKLLTHSQLLKHKESSHLNLLAKYQCSQQCCGFKTIWENRWKEHQSMHEKCGQLVINKRREYSAEELSQISDKINDLLEVIRDFETNGKTTELSDFTNAFDLLRNTIKQSNRCLQSIETNESNADNMCNNCSHINSNTYETAIDSRYELTASYVPNKQMDNKSIEATEAPVEYLCDWIGCDRVFDKQISLKVHKLNHQEKGYRCQWPDCSAAFTQQSYLKLHQKRHDGHYRCDYEGCSHRARNSKDLSTHKLKHTNERPFPCEQIGCDKRFKNKENLRMHRLVVHPEQYPEVEWIVCREPGCEYRCKLAASLSKHTRSHTLPLVCNVCAKRFSSPYLLRQHQTRHTGAKDYICGHCSKAYGLRKSLISHIQRKHNQRVFICALNGCAKQYGMERELKQHIRERHDTSYVRPMKCEWYGCEQTFRTRSDMKDHMNRHTGDKPYVCSEPDCGKAFKTRCDYHSHKSLHKGRQFACDLCHYKAITRSRLKIHSKRHLI